MGIDLLTIVWPLSCPDYFIHEKNEKENNHKQKKEKQLKVVDEDMRTNEEHLISNLGEEKFVNDEIRESKIIE